MSNNNSSILITGHSGFVGTNLAEVLGADFELYGLDITNKGLLPKEKVYVWDQLNNLPTVDAVIHLAGKAHDTADASKPQEYFDVNVGLTKQIFDWFLASQAKTFVFFSSVKAVADTVSGSILTEDEIPSPQTAYGQSKLAAEEYVLENNSNSRKRVFILRPCMIHGPGNKGNLNLLYKVVQKGLPWPLGAFNNFRSFATIENVAFAVRHLIEKEAKPGVYNLADDEPVSTNELIQMMAETLGIKPRIWCLPKGFVKSLANAGDILHLPLNTERLKKLTESYVVSNTKIKEALGINRMPVSATEGLKKTLSKICC